MDGNINVLLIH